MKKLIVHILCLLFLIASCATVPVTGRMQLNLISSETILSMSYQQYNDFLKENKISADKEETERVLRVGKNIQNAVTRYFLANNMVAQLQGYKWEYHLIESNEINAWCMPGGKVVIYTGILPITMDDAGLAVVMGHEIAHAIAQHGNERMSQQLGVQLGGMALATAMATRPALTQQLWMTAFGLGSEVGVLLPFSRLHESEADELGLMFMAMAGYDPRQAVAFWERMSKAKTGASPPEWLSTHPADQTRIQRIQALIPNAMRHYTEN